MRNQHSRKRPKKAPSGHEKPVFAKGLTLRERAVLEFIEGWFRAHQKNSGNRGHGNAAREGQA